MTCVLRDTWARLTTTYSSISDIDAYTGGLAETAPSDGMVGPLFACIIKQQFLRIRDGDRYFFTHRPDSQSSARPLKSVAKQNILARSLAAIMCDNIPVVTMIQEDVFMTPGPGNEIKPCNFTQLDLEGMAREIIGKIVNVYINENKF